MEHYVTEEDYNARKQHLENIEADMCEEMYSLSKTIVEWLVETKRSDLAMNFLKMMELNRELIKVIHQSYANQAQYIMQQEVEQEEDSQ